MHLRQKIILSKGVDNLDISDSKCTIEHEPYFAHCTSSIGNKCMDVILAICVFLHHSPTLKKSVNSRERV